MSVVIIGSVTAKPGKRTEGIIPVAENPEGIPVNIPVIVFNGSKNGPKLWVHACIHGDESLGAIEIIKALEGLDPRILNGTLIAIPILNITAFRSRQQNSPFDNLNMNRVFPGDLDGSFTQHTAAILMSEITKNADYLIDFHVHGGMHPILSCGWIAYHKKDTKASEAASKFAKALGLREKPDIILESKSAMLSHALFTTATDKGIPSLLVEVGGIYENKTFSMVNRAINNAMKHLAMIDGSPKLPKKHIFLSGLKSVTLPHSGMFKPIAKLGAPVSSGEILGTVTNVFGQKTENIISPIDGIIISMSRLAFRNSGAIAAEIGCF